MTEPTRLVFVRHGESNTTVARVIGGYRTCSGLSPVGTISNQVATGNLSQEE